MAWVIPRHYKSTINLNSLVYPTADPIILTAALVSIITGIQPPTPIPSLEELSFLKDLKLADTRFHEPGRIGLLLGQDVLGQIFRDGLVSQERGHLYAHHTFFGWVVGGGSSLEFQALTSLVCLHSSLDQDTHSLLRAFWEVEELPEISL